MNKPTTTTTPSKSNTQELAQLQQRYQSLLTRYKAAAVEYTTYLNNHLSASRPQMVIVPGYTLNGANLMGLNHKKTNTVEACQASCEKNKKCSGATFVSRRCMLKTGDSSLIPSTKLSYAIVSKEKKLLSTMESLNNQLLATNQQILRAIRQSEPVYRKNKQESNIKNTELLKRYDQLMKERKEIADLLADYDYLGDASESNTYSQYYGYWTWTIALFIVLGCGYYLLMNKSSQTIQTGGELKSSAYYIIGSLMACIVLINAYIKTAY